MVYYNTLTLLSRGAQMQVCVSAACLQGRKGVNPSQGTQKNCSTWAPILRHVAWLKNDFCWSKDPARKFSVKQGCCFLFSSRYFKPQWTASTGTQIKLIGVKHPYDKLLITVIRRDAAHYTRLNNKHTSMGPLPVPCLSSFSAPKKF